MAIRGILNASLSLDTNADSLSGGRTCDKEKKCTTSLHVSFPRNVTQFLVARTSEASEYLHVEGNVFAADQCFRGWCSNCKDDAVFSETCRNIKGHSSGEYKVA